MVLNLYAEFKSLLDACPELDNLRDSFLTGTNLRKNGPYLLADSIGTNLDCAQADDPAHLRVWEMAGLFYHRIGWTLPAMHIFKSLYEHLLKCQIWRHQNGLPPRIHKGMPLAWLCDLCLASGRPWCAQRYILLGLIEDAITHQGVLDYDQTGSLERLTNNFGRTAIWVREAALAANRAYLAEEVLVRMWPENLLLTTGREWTNGHPSQREFQDFQGSPKYVEHFQARAATDWKDLERLAAYLLACVPGMRVKPNIRSNTCQYDIIAEIEGNPWDFRDQLGRYIICECKSWKNKVDFAAVAKFSQVIQSAHCICGVLFSRQGITGGQRTMYAARQLLKSFNQSGVAIIVLDDDHLTRLAHGEDFVAMLRMEYENLRFDK